VCVRVCVCVIEKFYRSYEWILIGALPYAQLTLENVNELYYAIIIWSLYIFKPVKTIYNNIIYLSPPDETVRSFYDIGWMDLNFENIFWFVDNSYYNVLIEAIFLHVPKTVYIIICEQWNIKNTIFSFIDVSDGEKITLTKT